LPVVGDRGAGRYLLAVSSAGRRPFPPEIIERLDQAIEVDIETHAPTGVEHRTTIWVVVDGGEVFIRSYRGATARWYREALAGGDVALIVGSDRIPVQLSEATAAGDIARCSRVLESKYSGDPATPEMLRPEILDTTLRLEPA
jgi:hypothetical protein